MILSLKLLLQNKNLGFFLSNQLFWIFLVFLMIKRKSELFFNAIIRLYQYFIISVGLTTLGTTVHLISGNNSLEPTAISSRLRRKLAHPSYSNADSTCHPDNVCVQEESLEKCPFPRRRKSHGVGSAERIYVGKRGSRRSRKEDNEEAEIVTLRRPQSHRQRHWQPRSHPTDTAELLDKL